MAGLPLHEACTALIRIRNRVFAKKIRATLDGWLGPDSHDKVLAMRLPASCQLIFESTFGHGIGFQHDSVEDLKG